jgi:hypothetical protein
MNATERIEAAGIEFRVGQTLSIETPWGEPIGHTLVDGEYVILDAKTLKVYDVADGWETGESMAMERDSEGTEAGYVAVKVTKDGQEVMQQWRDLVADCWGVDN